MKEYIHTQLLLTYIKECLQIISVLLYCCLPGSPVKSLLQGVVEILHILQGSELALTLSLTKEKYLKLTLHFIN